ncbi:MAG: DUF5688 family protein, partial [Coprococcus sp.]
MNYNEFQETLLKELESRLDSHISLNPITTTKNNNTLKHGIEFSNDTSNISPVLYLDEWYELYLDGKSLSQIVDDIVDLYHQAANISFTDTETAELTPISDFLKNAFPDSNEFIHPNIDYDMEPELFILSNTIKQQGAICTLYDDIMNQIGETLQDDFFIIPSSVHE